MAELLIFLLIPLLLPFLAKAVWPHTITIPELIMNILAGLLVAGGGWGLSFYGQMIDVQLINGQVISKKREEVPCEHSYTCNCRQECSGSGDTRSCTTVCDTCYEHNNDYSWYAYSDVGKATIARIDRQGVKEPPRFTQVKLGEPFTTTESYVNYIKGASESLFNKAQYTDLAELIAQVPAYPAEVYDYYRADRAISVGAPVQNLKEWNTKIAEVLKKAGPVKEVNLVVLFTKNADSRYADAVNAKWLGGKKNDVIVVIGAPEYPTMNWVRILSWTDNEIFKVQLRDALLDQHTLDASQTVDLIAKHIYASFKRKPMEDFKYLKYEVSLSAANWVLLLAVTLAISFGLSYLFSRNRESRVRRTRVRF